MKWIGVAVLILIGIIAGVVAIEYLSQPIHALPSIIGGKHIRGHYKRRGEGLVVIAVAAIGAAVWLIMKIRRKGTSGGAGSSASSQAPEDSAATLFSGPDSPPE